MLQLFYLIISCHSASSRGLNKAEIVDIDNHPYEPDTACRGAIRSIVHLAKDLIFYRLTAHIRLLGQSILRPLLISAILNDNKPGWMNPSEVTRQLQDLVPELRNIDSYSLRATSYLKSGAARSRADSADITNNPNIFDRC